MNRVEELLRLTQRSLINQSNPNWRLIVVCNSPVRTSISDQRISYHQVSFPPAVLPTQRESTATPLSVRRDKGSKILAGLLFSRRWSSDYVMPIDCDDWIHKELVDWILARRRRALWYVNKGYFINLRTLRYKIRYGLVRYCGSTYIYTPQLLRKICGSCAGVGENSSMAELLASAGPTVIDMILGDHHYLFSNARRFGATCRPVRIPATSWIVDNGQNASGTTGSADGLPLTKHFASRFGVEHLVQNDVHPKPIDWVRVLAGAQKSRLDWLLSRQTNSWRF